MCAICIKVLKLDTCLVQMFLVTAVGFVGEGEGEEDLEGEEEVSTLGIGMSVVFL